MDIPKDGADRVAKTVITAGILLLFFFVQGAIVVVSGLKEIGSVAVRGFVLWGLVLITLAFCRMKHRKISLLGFQKINRISLKQL